MSKRNFVGLSTKGTQNKKSRDSFNLKWLKVNVATDTPDFKNIKVELSSIYKYSFENGLKCKICAACSSFETNAANEYATGKRWEAWKLDYCKRHLLSRIHAKNVQILYNQKHGISVKSLLTEKLADRTAHLDHAKCLQTNEKEIRILNGNVLLAINMNASMFLYKLYTTISENIFRYHIAGEVKIIHLSLLRQLIKLFQIKYLQNYEHPYSIHSLLMKALILQCIKC